MYTRINTNLKKKKILNDAQLFIFLIYLGTWSSELGLILLKVMKVLLWLSLLLNPQKVGGKKHFKLWFQKVWNKLARNMTG